MKKLLSLVSALSILIFSSESIAQVSDIQIRRQLIELKNNPIIASIPAERVGKGAFFWIIIPYDDYYSAVRIFSSCDGKIISEALDFEFSFDKDNFKRLEEIYRKINSIDISGRTATINFVDFDESEIENKAFIRKNVTEVCGKLKPERRGEKIPIAETTWQSDNTKRITSFMTGTITKNANIISGWFKSYDILRVEQKNADGSIIKFKNGNSWYINKIKDKSYSMIRWSFDCKLNKHVPIQIIEYDNSGTPVNTFTYPLDFKEVIPQSVGEKIHDNMCKVY